MAITVLATDVAEFGGPVGDDARKTGVRQAGVRGTAAAIETSAKRPAAIDAVFGVRIQAEGVLRLENGERRGRELIPSAPEEFGTKHEGFVDSAAEGLPADSGIGGIQGGQEIGGNKGCADAGIIVAASLGDTGIKVGRFTEVEVGSDIARHASLLLARVRETTRAL